MNQLQKRPPLHRKILAKNDYEFFFNTIIRQSDPDLWLYPHHKALVNNFEASDESLSILPRGHGKSVTSTSYLTHIAWKATKPLEILISSAKEKQALRNLNRIRSWIEDIPELRRDLYPGGDSKWSEGEIELKNGTRFYARPFSRPTSIRSIHADYVLLDDILEDDAITWEKAKRGFHEVLYPTLQTRKGKLMVTGTPQSFDDLLLGDLSDEEKFPNMSVLKMQAIDDKFNIPLWPEKYSAEKLERLRNSMGSASFNKEYMCKPIAAGTALFPYDLVKSCMGKVEIESEARAAGEYFLGADIALGTKKSSDYSVYFILKKFDGKLTQARKERYQGKPSDEQKDRLRYLKEKFNIQKGMIEAVGLSIDMANELTGVDKGFPGVFEPFITTRKTKELILSKLESYMRNKVLIIDESDETLIEELLTFGLKRDNQGKQTYEALGKHDDCVIALALAIEAADAAINYTSIESIDLDDDEDDGGKKDIDVSKEGSSNDEDYESNMWDI